MILGALKAIAGVAGNLMAFIFERWRVFLPLAMVVVGLWYVHSLREQRNDALQERDVAVAKFDDLVQLQIRKAEERKLENKRKEQQVQLKINSIMANHLATIKQVRGDYEKLKGEKAAADSSIALWRERVRLEVARGAARLSGISEAASELAGSGGDGDAAAAGSLLETLDRACSITTADYNALYESWTAACQVHRCE